MNALGSLHSRVILGVVLVLELVAITRADFQCTTQQGLCKCTSAANGAIDLAPLNNADNPMSWQQAGGLFKYQYNPCAGFSCGLFMNMAVCQQSTGVGLANGIGSASSAIFKFDTLKSQNYIEYTTNSFTSKVYLKCDQNEQGRITDGPIAQPTTEASFTLSSKLCCLSGSAPVTGGLSLGSVLLIIFFSLLAAYLIGGVLFLHFVKHESGANLVPNREFWVQVPGLVKDGCLLTYSTVRNLISGDRPGYSQV